MMKEKTIPMTSPPRKVKGTVLFTVVCVMMVLIVCLMGTLALAATANNRAMNTYSTAQTQATAKAGVNAIISAMQNNKDVAIAAAGVSAANPKEVVSNINIEYIGTDADGNSAMATATELGRITDASIEYAGEKYILDSEGNPVAKTVIKVSATATQGTASSTHTAYILRDVDTEESEDGENQGFVATGSATSGNHTSVYGGAYIGFDDQFRNPANWNHPISYTTYEACDAPTVYETDFQVNGNFKNDSGSDMYLVIKSPSTGMTVWGNMTLQHPLILQTTNAAANLFTTASPLNYVDIPYIYVDGTLDLNSAANPFIGTKNTDYDIPLNIFCDNIQVDVSNGVDINADLYCMGTGKSVIKGGNHTNLYSWISQVVEYNGTTASQHVGGNIYSKGSLDLGGSNTVVQGEVSVDGDLTITKDSTVNVYGDVYVGGNVTIESNAKLNIYGGTLHYNKDGGKTLSGASDTTLNIFESASNQRFRYQAAYDVTTAAYDEIISDAYVDVIEEGYVEEWDEYGSLPNGVTSDMLETFIIIGHLQKDGNAWHYVDGEGNEIERIWDNLVEYNGAYYSQYAMNGDVPQDWAQPYVVDKEVRKARNKDTFEIYDQVTVQHHVVEHAPVTEAHDAVVQHHDEVTTHYDAYYILNGVKYTEEEFENLHLVDPAEKDSVTPDESYNSSHYPKQYERDVILGTLNPDGSTATTDTYKIVHTVPEILANTSDPYKTEYAVPSTHATACSENVLTLGSSPAKSGYWDKKGKVYYVYNSCTITGSTSEGDVGVVIQAPATGTEIWVVLDNVSMTGAPFLIDDTVSGGGTTDGKINLYVVGNCTFSGSPAPRSNGNLRLRNGSPWPSNTYSYLATASIASQLSSSDTYQIYTAESLAVRNADNSLTYPKVNTPVVNVYAGKPASGTDAVASLTVSNNTTATANIKAPYMDFTQSSMGGSAKCNLYYNGYEIHNTPVTNIGCIGCMICHKFTAGNNWMLLYSGSGNGSHSTPTFEDAIMTQWQVLYYDNF